MLWKCKSSVDTVFLLFETLQVNKQQNDPNEMLNFFIWRGWTKIVFVFDDLIPFFFSWSQWSRRFCHQTLIWLKKISPLPLIVWCKSSFMVCCTSHVLTSAKAKRFHVQALDWTKNQKANKLKQWMLSQVSLIIISSLFTCLVSG